MAHHTKLWRKVTYIIYFLFYRKGEKYGKNNCKSTQIFPIRTFIENILLKKKRDFIFQLFSNV